MAIFDTSKLYFDIDDWRTQEKTLFTYADIIPWDDHIQFVARSAGASLPSGFSSWTGVTVPNDTSIQEDVEYNYKYLVKLSDVHTYGVEKITELIKANIARLVGGAITSKMLTILTTSSSISGQQGIDTAFVNNVLSREYYRRSTTQIILPFDNDKIDENGSYKGFPVVYTPYIKKPTSGTPFGSIIDMSQIFVAEYQSNGVKVLEEAYSDYGAVAIVGKYKFKVGLKDKLAAVRFTI